MSASVTPDITTSEEPNLTKFVCRMIRHAQRNESIWKWIAGVETPDATDVVDPAEELQLKANPEN